ncbi:MAG: N-methyl-L-tryptophan oxidase [Cytophagales bacterium]|nr:N-methyl-L-tryptophan oxidase [Armatimonadota bacterium]
MSSGSYEVIVLGVGAMGTAACWHLARRGVRVLGLEQQGIPNALGSSHGYSRAIRLAYFEHPDYVPLLKRAWALWRELEEVSGQTLLYPTGCLYLGPPDSALIQGSRNAAQLHGLPHESLDRQAIADRFGQFCVPDDYLGLFETRGGTLRPELSVAAMAGEALSHGAVLHGNAAVSRWEADANRVTVFTTAGETYHADRLVLSGGAWSSQVVTGIGVPLTVTRQVMGWAWPLKPDRFRLESGFPSWAIEHGAGEFHYGFPMLADNPGFKIARHAPLGEVTTPETVRRTPAPGDEATFRPALQQFFPDADGPTLAIRICLYTNSPDGHFILDRHPSHANVAVACGFSGHGFKFAPVIGEALADLATTGESALPIGFLGLSRFATAGEVPGAAPI